MREVLDVLDERLFELNGRMEWARVDFRPGVGPEGTVVWFRANAPVPERPYVSHRVYFRDDRAILESGRYDLSLDDALDDARRRAG